MDRPSPFGKSLPVFPLSPRASRRAARVRGVAARAFTLLELILSLALIAVVSGIAIPAYFGRPEITLENAAALLARDLRSAQNRAAYLGEPIQLTFDTRRHGYRVWRASGAREDESRGSFERLYSRDAVFEGVEITRVDFDGSHTLVFDASGRARSAGEVRLRYRGDWRILRVEAPSGRVVMLGSSRGWRDKGF